MAGDEDDVHELLQEKDEQLMRAAQLGQSLLARATELEQANELLREEHERASSSLEEQQYRVKELSGQSATLHQIVTAKERSVAELEQQIETARQSGYEQGVADAAVTPNGVPDGAEATADSRDQATEVELERLREQTRVLAEQEDALRAAMEAEGTGRRQAERKHKQMAEQLASSQEQLRSQTEREASIEAAREVEAEATEAERARVQELTVRLATMEEEVQRARAVLSDDALFSTMHTVMTAPPPAAPPPLLRPSPPPPPSPLTTSSARGAHVRCVRRGSGSWC
jgi:chromosome segregation ATPase